MEAGIVDFHTHAFPDELAPRAVGALAAAAKISPCLDGTIGALLAGMDEAGVRASVIASIATRPGQFDAILRWSEAIRTERVIPFASIHPDDPELVAHVRRVVEAGLKGIKLHPYYQACELDEPKMYPFYREIERQGLILLCHTGFDTAYERKRIADPIRIVHVREAFPRLKLVTTHLGAWEDWDAAEELLVGRPVYMDISYSIDVAGAERSKRILQHHPAEYLVFGSDSPWGDQRQTLQQLRSLGLGEARERALLWENACRLLEL